MDEATRQRLFGYQHALDHPVTRWIVAVLVGLLVLTPSRRPPGDGSIACSSGSTVATME